MAEDQQGALGELPKLCHEVCCRKIHPLSSVTYPIFTDSFQNCDSQELRVATSRSGYPKKRTLPLTEDFCLIVEKMRNICKDKHRAKAFEEHYKYETPLTGGEGPLDCAIVRGETQLKLHCYVSPQFVHPDPKVAHHCHLQDGQKTLYNPDSKEGSTARAAEDLLEKAVARYAEDNMLVVRVRKPSSIPVSISLVSGFPEGPLLPEDGPGPEDVGRKFLRVSRGLSWPLSWAFRHVRRGDLLPCLPFHHRNLQGKGDVRNAL